MTRTSIFLAGAAIILVTAGSIVVLDTRATPLTMSLSGRPLACKDVVPLVANRPQPVASSNQESSECIAQGPPQFHARDSNLISSSSVEVARRQATLRVDLEAADRVEDPGKRMEILSTLCCQWAEIDPRGAIDLVFRYRLDQSPGGLLENIAQQWAATDFVSARAWIDGQPVSNERSRIMARFGFLWSQFDPVMGAKYVLGNIPPGPDQNEAVLSVLHQWAVQDSDAAVAWSMKFPHGALRRRAMQEAGTGARTALAPQSTK